ALVRADGRVRAAGAVGRTGRGGAVARHLSRVAGVRQPGVRGTAGVVLPRRCGAGATRPAVPPALRRLGLKARRTRRCSRRGGMSAFWDSQLTQPPRLLSGVVRPPPVLSWAGGVPGSGPRRPAEAPAASVPAGPSGTQAG